MTADTQVNVSRRMAKGAAWMVLLRILERTIGLVSTLILARLLVPEDFGLVAMAMAILAVLELVSAFSFDIALIQNPKAERRHFDTAWTFNVLFGLCIAVLLIALASPAASFYDEPRIERIMYAIALTSSVAGFANIGVVAFQKELLFEREFRLGLLKKLIGFAVTISLAYTLGNYWALVIGSMASSFAGVLLTYQMHPYRPRFGLKGHKELFNFSKWLFLNNVLIVTYLRLPDFVVGKLAGPSELGSFSIAYEISQLPTTELVNPVSRAVFPGYAKMAGDVRQLADGYLDVLSLIALIAIPAGIGIALLAEPVVYIMLGAKWSGVIPVVELLAIQGIIRACTANVGSVYLALGLTRIIALFAAAIIVILFPLLLWLVGIKGATGAAWALLAVSIIMLPFMIAVIVFVLPVTLQHLLEKVWRPMMSGLIMAFAIFSLRIEWSGLGYLEQIASLVPVGALVYTSCIVVLWRISGSKFGGERILLDWFGTQIGRLRTRLSRGDVA